MGYCIRLRYALPVEEPLEFFCGRRQKRRNPLDVRGDKICRPDKTLYYPTALSRIQITPKTSSNITQYFYPRGPLGQVFSKHTSDELD